MKNKNGKRILEFFSEIGFDFRYKEIETKIGIFSNKKLLITGTLSHSREYFKELIISYGGKLSSSISKNLDYCLIGDKPSMKKIEKIKNLNIKIFNE
jgi:DNA ligase (NAD+)